MVRKTSKSLRDRSSRDPLGRTAGIVALPKQRARSFAGADLGINDQVIEREVIARADEDFERIFGAE
jgi:hypothetical protein